MDANDVAEIIDEDTNCVYYNDNVGNKVSVLKNRLGDRFAFISYAEFIDRQNEITRIKFR
jgi:hypothetical protein